MAELNRDLFLIVMAGGSGTRFWPRSRAQKPKQLLNLWDDKSLIEHSLSRFSNLVNPAQMLVVTNQKLVPATQALLKNNYPYIKYLAEPEAKNTAPCILWGCLEIQKINPNAKVIVIPADAFIGDQNKYLESIKQALVLAEEPNCLVTLGIKPTKPETGYGYIKRKTGSDVMVERFVEKPNLVTAQQYVADKNYFWNAGIFIFSVQSALKAFTQTTPKLFELLSKNQDQVSNVFSTIAKEDATSFDYAVMEKVQNFGFKIAMVPSDCGWNDVGSYAALPDIKAAHTGTVLEIDSKNNIVQTDQGLVALLGVEDCIVIREGDIVLVTPKSQAQDIKKIVDQLKSQNSKYL